MKKQSSYTKTCSLCGFTSSTRDQWATHKERDIFGSTDCGLVKANYETKHRVGLS